jgi:hypothetical protein
MGKPPNDGESREQARHEVLLSWAGGGADGVREQTRETD